MVSDIVIAGAGGLGREVYALIQALPNWRVSGFYDDRTRRGDCVIHDACCLGSIQELRLVTEKTYAVVAIGDPVMKKTIVQELSGNASILYPSLIHPSAVIMDTVTVKIGAGVVIAAHVSITTNVQIDDHVLVNLHATIGHDSTIGKFSSIMPGANISGAVTIEEAALIGSGAVILNRLVIGASSRVGAGAVVTKDVNSGACVVGVPARPFDNES